MKLTLRAQRLISHWSGFGQSGTGSAQHPEQSGEKGPYNVGFTTFCAGMSAGRVTRVQVFYPTLDRPDYQADYPVYLR